MNLSWQLEFCCKHLELHPGSRFTTLFVNYSDTSSGFCLQCNFGCQYNLVGNNRLEVRKHTYIQTYILAHSNTCTCTLTYMQTYIHAHTHITYTHTSTYIHTHTFINHTYIYTYIHTNIVWEVSYHWISLCIDLTILLPSVLFDISVLSDDKSNGVQSHKHHTF